MYSFLMVMLDFKQSILGSQKDADKALNSLNYVKSIFFFTIQLDLKRSSLIVGDVSVFLSLYIFFSMLFSSHNTDFLMFQ